MKTLQTSDERMQELCELLKSEAIEPAQKRADEIVQDAKAEAQQIIDKAQREANGLLEAAKKEIAKEKNIFESALNQAAHQAIGRLRQEIEETLFGKNLKELLHQPLVDTDILQKLLLGLIEGVQKEGLSTDFSALVPKCVDKDKLNTCLGQQVVEKLKEGTVLNVLSSGGVKLKLNDKQLTIDVTDEVLVDLLSQYMRKDFREQFFK